MLQLDALIQEQPAIFLTYETQLTFVASLVQSYCAVGLLCQVGID